MKNKIIIGSVAALAVLAALGGLFGRGRSAQVEWQTMQMEKGPFKLTVRAMGSVKPENKIVVSPPVAGRVDKVLVNEGQKVKQGQIIAWMSSTDRAALLDAARSQGAQAIAEWENVYKPTPIMAAKSGTIILRNVVEGQTVTPSSQLFEISDRLIIQAQVDETDMSKIRLGQKAEVRIDAFPDRVLSSKVSQIGHQSVVVSNVNVYQVQLLPDSIPADLRAGMGGTISFIISESDSANLIPTWLSGGKENGEVELFVRGADGKPQKRVVRVGSSDGEKVEVLANLSESDTILYRPMKIFSDEKKSPLGLWNTNNKKKTEKPKSL